jgi:hypothetical protein
VDACWPNRDPPDMYGGRRTASLALVAGVQLLEFLRDKGLWGFVADPQAWDLADVANAVLKMGALLRLLRLVAQAAGSGLLATQRAALVAAFPRRLYARPSVLSRLFEPTPLMADALLLYARTVFRPAAVAETDAPEQVSSGALPSAKSYFLVVTDAPAPQSGPASVPQGNATGGQTTAVPGRGG